VQWEKSHKNTMASKPKPSVDLSKVNSLQRNWSWGN